MSDIKNVNLQEVEKRFDLAHCYRTLLKQPLFPSPTEASNAVQNELRAFMRERMGALMGLTPEKDTGGSTFSKTEVIALKALAAKILGQGDSAKEEQEVEAKEQEKIKKYTEVKKSAKVEEKKVKSKLAKTNNKIKPPPESTNSAAEMGSAEETSFSAPEGALASDGNYYHEGQIVEENGQKFKIKIQEVEGNKYVLRQNVTPQVVPNNKIPMPSSAQMEQLSRQQALDALQNIGPLGLAAVQNLTQTE